MLRIIITLTFFSFIGFSSIHVALADIRSYAWTYEYQVMEKGEAELESYMTLSSPDLNEMKGNTSTEMRYEYEIGMTNNFDFAIYQIFKQSPTSSFQYEGYKFRARYKIGEKGDFFIDPLIYAEYSGKPDFSQHELEFKLILAKDFGDFNFAFNPIVKLEKAESDWETLLGYTFGMKYGISDLTGFGFEFKGDKYGHYFGPTISHGTHTAYVVLGSLLKISEIKENKPEMYIRLLMGFAL
jgi:hypothetical protein